jgi:uncharacterized protein (TIGR00255 family)
MTGFARQEGGDDSTGWSWEIKSVNGRNLDVRNRLPIGYESLESVIRAAVPVYCARGNIQINLTVDRSAAPPRLQVNKAALAQVIAALKDLEGNLETAPPQPEGLLGLKGVLELMDEEESAEILAARLKRLEADLSEALSALAAMRREEGGRLAAIVRERLDLIAGLVEDAGANEASQPNALRERLKTQVEELLQASPALPEERLAQEAALLAAKADIREELDRLRAHVAAARDMLASGGPIGRKLDFLCQEFNREANTLCAKSPDVALTRIGLDLKAAVEQLREQIQNIE